MRVSVVLLVFVFVFFYQNETMTKDLSKTPEPRIAFQPESYVCYKTAEPLDIDGRSNEAAWQHAEWTADFRDIEGDHKPTPRFRTRAKMLWDEHYFYVFADIEEPDVWATLKKRDSIIFYDNDFEVFIDPNGDTHRYYELEINAFGTEWDLFLDKPYRDDGRAIFFWDIIGLQSAVQVNGTLNRPGDVDEGWTLEIALPWDVLKEAADKNAPPLAGDQWRVNFSRVEWQTRIENGAYVKMKNPDTNQPLHEDNWVWSPQGVVNMHYPEMWGFVQFSDNISGTASEPFVFNTNERAKWALRHLYYKQKAFYEIHNTYTEDISRLNLQDYTIDGYSWPPETQCTPNLFEAVLTSDHHDHSWHIDQDGRVWQQKTN